MSKPRGSQGILLGPIRVLSPQDTMNTERNDLFSFWTGTASCHLSHNVKRGNIWQERIRATHRKMQRQTRREKKSKGEGGEQEIINKLLGFPNPVILKDFLL